MKESVVAIVSVGGRGDVDIVAIERVGIAGL